MEAMVRKLALLLASFSAITGLLTLTAVAGPEDKVTATVTAVVISVNVSPESVSYGSQPIGQTDAVPNNMPLTIKNDGTVNERFSFRGTHSQDWTLGSPQGPNTFVHKYSTSGSPGTFTALTTSNQELAQTVMPNGEINLHLRMDLPTAPTVTTTQSTDVFVVATLTTLP
jgi:hypothetical protein